MLKTREMKTIDNEIKGGVINKVNLNTTSIRFRISRS